MRRLVFTLVAAAALAITAPAQAHGPAIGPAPGAAELAGDGWERDISGRNAAVESTCVRLAPGVYQPVSDDGSPVDCDLPPGARLFVQFGLYCASFEGVRDPWAQRRCVTEGAADITSLDLAAGGRTVRISQPRFAFITRWRWVWVPEGENRGLQTFTAAGHAAIIDNLRAGDTVTLAVGVFGETFTFIVHVR